MALFGLIGKPLSHSFSKQYFEEKFKRENLSHRFELFELDNLNAFADLMNGSPELKGLAVTIPYKKKIIPLLDMLDETALATGAVNCIRMGDKLVGYNTDVIGFRESLLNFLGQHKPEKALVLGTGGAAAAVHYVLQTLQIEVQFVSRVSKPGVMTYEILNQSIIQQYPLIVQCTPLGMYPFIDAMPRFPVSFLSNEHMVFDLIYNPSETLFMKRCAAQGARVINGLEMLHIQAEANWKLWQKEDV